MAPGQSKGKDLYRILGVAPGATPDEVKKAYRRKAREMHPDLDPGNPWAEDEFKELSAAYQILSDPVRRAQYDRGETDAAGRKKTSRADDAARTRKGGFEGFFRNRAGPDIDGVDVNYVLKVGFLEAARGAYREMKTTHGATLKVTVPPGTVDGQVLVPLETAVLGGKMQVETIDGLVNVTVPANSNTGTRLRLRGRGLADGGRKSGERGDHYVTLVVTLPKNPDPELAEFIRKRTEK